MKEFREKRVIEALLKEIKKKAGKRNSPLPIMEVCGTHTMTIHRFGLKDLLETAGVKMVSGPGCPVCITPNEFHEAAIELVTKRENLILTTFGDMTRVPTLKGSLQNAVPAMGSLIKIVYSPQESLELARINKDKEIVFFGVGFETTIPSIVQTVRKARAEGVENYSVLSAFWLIPPPLKSLLEAKDVAIAGFLYPGHVSAIIGIEPYQFIPRDYGIPGVITGFEPADILLAIISILDQIREGRPTVFNEYSRVVRLEGNPRAKAIMEENLEPIDAHWRGLGVIPLSGLRLKGELHPWDTIRKYELEFQGSAEDLPGCRCGEVIKGKLEPPQCPLFSRRCNPDNPCGPCMVSFEGPCLAHYKYRKK